MIPFISGVDPDLQPCHKRGQEPTVITLEITADRIVPASTASHHPSASLLSVSSELLSCCPHAMLQSTATLMTPSRRCSNRS